MTPSHPDRIVVICGPTGSGKTRFAIDLAQVMKGEIVGADSMQIFRHMDVGTAKPTIEEQSAAPHHLIDIINPDVPFDAASYVKRADEAIAAIVQKGKTPLIVGGTGLYIKALIFGLFQSPPTDANIRNRLKEKAKIRGNEYFHQYLTQIDPTAAEKINPNDTQRILRAIEFFEITGTRISAAQKEHAFSRPRYRSLKLGLQIEREYLYHRINLRVDAMLEEGLLEEVRKLLRMGYTSDMKPMQALGYRHMVSYINGELSWQEAVRTLKRDHRRYAKRQMTWFCADREIHWISPEQNAFTLNLIKNFLH